MKLLQLICECGCICEMGKLEVRKSDVLENGHDLSAVTFRCFDCEINYRITKKEDQHGHY